MLPKVFVAPPSDGKKHFRINHVIYSAIVGVVALVSFFVALLFSYAQRVSPHRVIAEVGGVFG